MGVPWRHPRAVPLLLLLLACLVSADYECPDVSVCPPRVLRADGSVIRQGVFKIQGGDSAAGFATLFITYVVNGVLYARHKGYVPFVSIESAHGRGFGAFESLGHVDPGGAPLWDKFFLPFCAGVEQWAIKCPETVQFIEKPLTFYYPGMHLNFRWAVHAWNYGKAPCKREKRACNMFDAKTFLAWRTKAAAVLKHSHVLSPEMAQRVNDAMDKFRGRGPATPTLGVHMRGTDKAHGRRLVRADEFAACIDSFLRAHPTGRVFAATDSVMLQKATEARFGNRVHFRRILTRVGEQIGPLGKLLPNFAILQNKTDVAVDVLVDIECLAQLDYFVYAASAVAEAVFYRRPALHYSSVNVEYLKDVPIDIPWSADDVLERTVEGSALYLAKRNATKLYLGRPGLGPDAHGASPRQPGVRQPGDFI
ncbi:hypothetical protein M885DRAFT_617344 [Pelagophyceae sp. CCMP2097]|nr:hypothetical protein M885DRAFT_617344 [Pelagophyceae sp. CCMP2097]